MPSERSLRGDKPQTLYTDTMQEKRPSKGKCSTWVTEVLQGEVARTQRKKDSHCGDPTNGSPRDKTQTLLSSLCLLLCHCFLLAELKPEDQQHRELLRNANSWAPPQVFQSPPGEADVCLILRISLGKEGTQHTQQAYPI